jgi:hypothetical protein
MTAIIPTGPPGISIDVGDHICAFYRGEAERDQVLIPYLTEGLAAGDRCICVLDRSQPDEFVGRLGGVELDRRGQLSLLRSADSYLKTGAFHADDMLAFWAGMASEAFDQHGYRFLRAVGEMTWALEDLPGVDSLVNYEARLNRFLPNYPQTILCLYDLELFTNGGLLIDILRTHPKVMMSGALLDNPWFIEPDQFLDPGP